MTGFQTQVNTVPAPGIAGDFASANPYFTVDAGPGALVAGALGVYVGRFAWWNAAQLDADGAPALVNNTGSGAPTGFVGRNQQGLITTYLDEASMGIAPGFEMFLYNGGDFWVQNDGTTDVQIGQKVFAKRADGTALGAAAGAAPSTGSVTGSISAQTSSFTGVVVGNRLTATAVTGLIVPGETLTGTAPGFPTTPKVVSQLSGTDGGAGVYTLDKSNLGTGSDSGAVTGAYGLLNVSAVSSGVLGVGDVLSGTGVTTGTTITALKTGTGGTGTYYVDPTQAMSSSALTVSLAVETKWYAMSPAAPGQVFKMSDHPLG